MATPHQDDIADSALWVSRDYGFGEPTAQKNKWYGW